MAKKTAAKRPAEKHNPYWKKFRTILQGGQDYGEALALALAMPRQDIPVRRYHTNLLYFLQDFSVPKGATLDERAMYLELVRRFEASGEIKPGVRRQLEQALHANTA